LTARQVVARLLATLNGKQTTRDSSVGYGTINIAAAVNNNVPADAPNPVFAAADPFQAQDAAIAATPAAPKVRPATTRTGLPGDFAVSPVPDPLTSGPGLGGLIGAAIGLACLAFLIVGATRRRRGLAGVGSARSIFDPPTVPLMLGPITGTATPAPDGVVETPSTVDSPEPPGDVTDVSTEGAADEQSAGGSVAADARQEG